MGAGGTVGTTPFALEALPSAKKKGMWPSAAKPVRGEAREHAGKAVRASIAA